MSETFLGGRPSALAHHQARDLARGSLQPRDGSHLACDEATVMAARLPPKAEPSSTISRFASLMQGWH